MCVCVCVCVCVILYIYIYIYIYDSRERIQIIILKTDFGVQNRIWYHINADCALIPTCKHTAWTLCRDKLR